MLSLSLPESPQSGAEGLTGRRARRVPSGAGFAACDSPGPRQRRTKRGLKGIARLALPTPLPPNREHEVGPSYVVA